MEKLFLSAAVRCNPPWRSQMQMDDGKMRKLVICQANISLLLIWIINAGKGRYLDNFTKISLNISIPSRACLYFKIYMPNRNCNAYWRSYVMQIASTMKLHFEIELKFPNPFLSWKIGPTLFWRTWYMIWYIIWCDMIR